MPSVAAKLTASSILFDFPLLLAQAGYWQNHASVGLGRQPISGLCVVSEPLMPKRAGTAPASISMREAWIHAAPRRTLVR